MNTTTTKRTACDNRWEDGCRNAATKLVQVPWTNVKTGLWGEDWTPFCTRCAAALKGCDWDVKEI